MLGRKAKSLEEVCGDVESHIRSIRDFPKKGINFRDIMPIFLHPSIVSDMCDAIAHHIRTEVGEVNAIAAIEARGFLFGPIVAVLLGVPFVPIRKRGKLPGECIQQSYTKEYGEDIIELQKDAVPSGWKIVVLDDLLATGSSLKAAVDILRKAGSTILEAFVLIELRPLRGREKLAGINVKSLILYNEA